jgi:D-psicose/D-tagatose/L-ribulose 3-epimerase
LDWPSILQALKDIDYSGRFVFELFVKPERSIGKDIRIWRDLSGQAHEEEMAEQLKEGLQYLNSTFSP